jgi:hypothetical protein
MHHPDHMNDANARRDDYPIRTCSRDDRSPPEQGPAASPQRSGAPSSVPRLPGSHLPWVTLREE